MKYLHYTEDPFLPPLESRVEEMVNSKWSSFKPMGLWVTTDGEDNWPTWCREEQWGLDRLRFCHEVTLRPAARFLRITSTDELYAFDKKYRCRRGDYGDHGFSFGIRWYDVTDEYDGIMIAPYQWSCRYAMSWYYGWDCASGVIWDASAIQCVELTTLLEVPAPHNL